MIRELGKIQNKFKPVHLILVFKCVTDVWCKIIPPWKKRVERPPMNVCKLPTTTVGLV